MLAVEKKKKYTVADYMLLEEGAPFQLINYDLVVSPSPNSIHQAIAVRISTIIVNYLDSKDMGGYVAISMDVVFNNGNVFQPDVLYVSAEREREIVKDRIEGAPNIAVEILSPSNASYDLQQKKNIYETFGVNEYIIIDPVSKTADLYVLKDGAYLLNQKVQKPGQLSSLAVPGLIFDLNKIFR